MTYSNSKWVHTRTWVLIISCRRNVVGRITRSIPSKLYARIIFKTTTNIRIVFGNVKNITFSWTILYLLRNICPISHILQSNVVIDWLPISTPKYTSAVSIVKCTETYRARAWHEHLPIVLVDLCNTYHFLPISIYRKWAICILR